MSEAKKNVERTRHIFEEMARTGGPQPLLDEMADDAVYKLSLPKGTPLSGEFRGMHAIREYFDQLEEVLEILVVNTWDFVGNGDQVIVLGDEQFVVKKTGKTCYSEFAFILDFSGGKIVRVLVIEDLSGVVEAYSSASSRVASRASGA
ncbi:nuclear transport factor 2 family protein [Archangium sp.]|uniref:nuclear transport factor 2 family protein n=1 Tax=Archangium sp. TaxID=1872627 RepID=UPI002D516F4A|nr:nuclear transport factor 2 family protein [Archangium sp.]HYO55338.1 nuclear transport factor 2 family protein [Archangium sp.]